MIPELENFHTLYTTQVQWGEMDAFGHVNNAVYFRYFESARIRYFADIGYLDLKQSAGIGPILHSTQCRFRLPLTYPDEITVGVRVSELQPDRFLMVYRLVSARHQRIGAEGYGLIVNFDYQQKQKAPLPEELRLVIIARDQPQILSGRG